MINKFITSFTLLIITLSSFCQGVTKEELKLTTLSLKQSLDQYLTYVSHPDQLETKKRKVSLYDKYKLLCLYAKVLCFLNQLSQVEQQALSPNELSERSSSLKEDFMQLEHLLDPRAQDLFSNIFNFNEQVLIYLNENYTAETAQHSY